MLAIVFFKWMCKLAKLSSQNNHWLLKQSYLYTMDKYYKHFKGGLYKYIGTAKDSETLEEMVVYHLSRNASVGARYRP